MTKFDDRTWRCGPPPKKGQFQRFPSRFWFNFKKFYPQFFEYVKGDDVIPAEGMKILNMFSGSISWGDTTDIRPESGATFIADYDSLPIPDNMYDLTIADPAYADFFSKQWSQNPKDHPIPKRILVEAARVTKVGGIIAILHIILIRPWKEANVKCIARHPIFAGENNVIRCLNVFRKGKRTDEIQEVLQ